MGAEVWRGGLEAPYDARGSMMCHPTDVGACYQPSILRACQFVVRLFRCCVDVIVARGQIPAVGITMEIVNARAIYSASRKSTLLRQSSSVILDGPASDRSPAD